MEACPWRHAHEGMQPRPAPHLGEDVAADALNRSVGQLAACTGRGGGPYVPEISQQAPGPALMPGLHTAPRSSVRSAPSKMKGDADTPGWSRRTRDLLDALRQALAVGAHHHRVGAAWRAARARGRRQGGALAGEALIGRALLLKQTARSLPVWCSVPH